VLSYVPDVEELEFATRMAHGSSLAVVETVAFPIAGWASWLGAWNLIADEATPAITDGFRVAVERLKFYANNAFSDQFGKQQARRILSELRGFEEFDRDFLLGAALGSGVSARGVRNLRRLLGTPSTLP
jgi:hypothetical protein